MMRLWWSPRSPFVRLVLVTAHELGLAARISLVPVVVGGTTPHPMLTADNPLGKIPALITEDGVQLYDSAVICSFLEHLAQTRLTPEQPAARFTALRLRALAEGMLDVNLQRVSERARPEPVRSAPHLALWAAKIAAALDALEAQCGVLAALPFGAAQIGVGVALGYLDFRFGGEPWRATHAGLAGWQAGFDARASAIATTHTDAAAA